MTDPTSPAPYHQSSSSSKPSASSPSEIVSTLLQNTSNLSVVTSLCTPDCTYVSLTYSNPPLAQILPYAGRHPAEGPGAILSTFATVGKIWANEEFTVDTIFNGANYVASGEGQGVFPSSGFEETDPAREGIVDVAVFGSFTYRSRTLGRAFRSPYNVWCKVDVKLGKVVYMQFMEDTLGSTSVFKTEKGYGRFKVDPDTGKEIDVE